MDRKNPYLLPIAIVIAGIILAFAIYIVRTSSIAEGPQGNAELVRPISETDHIIGSPSAPVVIVEYSDIDCAYCKTFQVTLAQLMTEYAPSGQVAWVYRHFPLVGSHPNAGTHAEAAECAAELGGSDAFWRFIDGIHQVAPAAAQFDPKNYGSIVSPLGIDTVAFNACVTSNRYEERVVSDLNNAVDSGARGTPFTVLLIRGQEPVVISGALPYNSLKAVIDDALSKVN